MKMLQDKPIVINNFGIIPLVSKEEALLLSEMKRKAQTPVVEGEGLSNPAYTQQQNPEQQATPDNSGMTIDSFKAQTLVYFQSIYTMPAESQITPDALFDEVYNNMPRNENMVDATNKSIEIEDNTIDNLNQNPLPINNPIIQDLSNKKKEELTKNSEMLQAMENAILSVSSETGFDIYGNR